MSSGRCLLAAVLIFLAGEGVQASEDLSGRWTVRYDVLSGSPGDLLAEGSVIELSENNGTLQGRATLGLRGDGYLIGCFEDGAVRAAITFRQSPTQFVRLSGDYIEGELHGNFTLSGKEGFWQGKFTAVRMTTAYGESLSPQAEDSEIFTPTDPKLLPKPTLYIDPESNWSAQQETGVKKIFVISYEKNTILMCRNKPMIWQWWL